MEIVFKKLDNGDISDAVKLINTAYRNKKTANAWTTEAGIVDGKRVDEDMFKYIVNDPDSVIYAAYGDDKLVGSIQTKLQGENVYIGLFAVDQQFQSCGIGKGLLEYAQMESLKIWSFKSFVMSVVSGREELIDFYLRRGYEKTDAYLDFPESDLWNPCSDLKLVVLKKEI